MAYPARNIAAAFAVLLLHAVAIVALLSAIRVYTPALNTVSERITWLALKPPPPATPLPHSKRPQVPQASVPTMPDFRTIVIPPAPNNTTLRGLQLSPLNCAPENYSTFTAEQRAQCSRAAPKPNDSVDYADHSNRAHDAVRWARALARKQNPLLLPCMSPHGIGIGPSTLACVGSGLLGHFDLDGAPGYGDGPGTAAQVPNGGDPPPPPAYDMRH